jgi:kinesin family protein 11
MRPSSPRLSPFSTPLTHPPILCTSPRPPSSIEIAARTPQVIKCDEAVREVTLTQNINGKQFGRTYHFDKVFAPDTTQERLYDSAISPIVDEVLQGFNCTIFAYGQTGTGKTHTMTGDVTASASMPDGAGVIPRAVAQIFAHLESIGGSTEYTVKCCFLELYNEEITDLLTLSTGSDAPKVRILEDRSGVVMQGLEEPHVKTAADIYALLETGNARRRTAETLLNKQSSRSHSVFIVTVSVREVLAEGEEVIRVGKLYLVDLAGSENVSRSGAVDQRAKEAGNINKSLLTLGRVITALVEGQVHVPYRDSKLTRLLRDSLGGRTKTCIIATIAPTVQCQEETLSTLDYAHRAKNIKNKPEVNQKISKTTHLKELAQEMARLKAELVATRAKNGVFLPPEQYEAECEERRILSARVEELEEEVAGAAERAQEEKAALTAEWEGRLAEVRGELDDTRAVLEATRAELSAARTAIAEREYMLEAHRRAETALAGHAGELNAGLSAAAADVAQLFCRVDAKNGIEETNLKVVQGMKTDATERLAALEAAVGAAAAEQAARFAGTRDQLSNIATRKAATRETMEREMSGLKGRINELGAAADAAAKGLAAAGATALEGLGAQQAEFLKVAQAAAEEASSALSEAYEALTASAAEEKAALEALVAGQTAATEAVAGATSTIVTAVQNALSEAQAQAEAAKAAVGESLAAQAAAAEQMSSGFAAAARKEQEALMGQLSALISGFVDRAEGQVTTAADGMRAALGADQDRLQATLGGLAAGAGQALEGLAANAAAADAAQEGAAAELQAAGDKAAAALEASASHAADVEAAARDHASAAATALAKHGKAVAAAVKKEAAALDAAATKQGATLAAEAEGTTEACTTVQEAVTADLSADGNDVAALETATAEGAAALAAFATAQAAGLTDVSTDIVAAVDEAYATDAGRNDVPAARERAVPPRAAIDALRAPPADALLAQFRAAAGADDLPCSGVDLFAEETGLEAEAPNVEPAVEGPEEVLPTAPIEPEDAEEEDGEENMAPADAEPSPAPRRRSARVKPLSPTKTGQKRARSGDDVAEGSPSKLRAAFARGERRRTTRHAVE